MNSLFVGYVLVGVVCAYSTVLVAVNLHALWGARVMRWWNERRLASVLSGARAAAFLVPVLLMAGGTAGHFVFVVPGADGALAKLIMSESLTSDDDVDVTIIGTAKLVARDDAGRERALVLDGAKAKTEHAYAVDLGGAQTRVVYGMAEVGVTKRGEGKAFLLTYYPKAIVGDGLDEKALVGEKTPVEIVPVGKAGALRFKLLVGGKAVPAGVELTVIPPDGKEKKVTTEADGATAAFDQIGRYGIWARSFAAETGERDGKKYEQVRRYATLVVDIGARGKK